MKNDFTDQTKNSTTLFLGLFWSFVTILLFSSGVLITKILVNDIDPEVMLLYSGIFGSFLSFIFIIIFRIQFILDFGFILLCMGNGFFNFCGLMLQLNNIKSNQVILISCFSFLPIFYAFIFGVLFFGEGITINDFFAFSLIICYSLYNLKYPPKQNR
jgi:drug/metabolite transporter (DMT)-like permease